MGQERITQLFNIFLPMNTLADYRYCRLAVSVAAPEEASGVTLGTARLGDFTLLRAFFLRYHGPNTTVLIPSSFHGGLPPYLPRSFRIRRWQFGAPQSHWNGEAISDSFTR
jgi:hypothetical protein